MLHGVRILGAPTVAAAAEVFALDPAFVREALLDAEARGWVSQFAFFGSTTWSLTEAGRVANEAQLAGELDAAGVRDVVVAAHAAFVPLNQRHGEACTRWQLRPMGDRLAANDHLDRRWDATVVRELAEVGREFEALCIPRGSDHLTAG